MEGGREGVERRGGEWSRRGYRKGAEGEGLGGENL